ncbi:hypothetical protein C8A00DRAFT_18874 [Chaetomidium leptoderma]|uniref:Nicotinamide-nucleotide adenylyltransferase n=1 Tax=Chaetomidium leptoderma TaxID=669021 RepID=A0AAN6VE65_9PEZI|nr:hypothetical protein C8A00DRAFT_18874 [Chaetomidium leptoderma]
MSPQLPASARSVADFFTRALSSFQSSRSKLQIICTAAAPALPHPGGADHGQQPVPLPPSRRPRTVLVLDSSFNPPTRAHLRMATSAIRDLAHTERGQKLDTSLRLLLLLSVNNADKGTKPAAFDKRLAMMWAFARDVQHSLRTGSEEAELASGEGPGGYSAEEALSVDIGLATLPYFHDKSAALAEGGFYNDGDAPENDGIMGEKTEQVFLVGFDTLIRIFNPKYYGPPLESTAQLAGPAEEVTPMQQSLDPFLARAKLRVTMRTGDEWGGADEQTGYLEDLLRADGLGKVGGNKDWGSRIDVVEGRKVGADIISSTHARAAAKDRDPKRLDLMVTPGVRWWIEQEGLYTE